MIKDNQKSLNRFHVVLDACVTAFSYLLAWFIVIGSGWANQLGKRTLEVGFYFGALLVIIPAYLLLYSLFGLYTPKRVLGRRNEFGKIFKANSIGFLIFGLVLYLGRKEPHLYNFSQRLVVYFYVLNVAFMTIERNGIRIVLRSMRSKGYNQKHILLVGYSSAAEGFIDRVNKNPEWGYKIRGIIDDTKERGSEYKGVKVIGCVEDLDYILEQNSLDEIAVTLSLGEYEKLRHIVALCEKSGVHTKFIPDYGNIIPTIPYMEDLQGLPVIHIRRVPLNDPVNAALKRAVDIVGAIVGIILFSPIMLIVALLIKLTSPVSATDVKVTILSADAGTINWVNVGINEIEIYGSINNDYSLSDVAGMITGGTTIAADVADFPMPTVPEGFNIRINGADFEQIISRDGKIVHPLTDKTVKVSYVITKEETGEELVTDDFTYTIAGQHTTNAAKNTKPSIIPEIAEWYSDSTDSVATDSITAVTYDNNALEDVVNEFIADYKDFSGIELQKVKGNAKANAFNFSLSAPDELLGDEGYTMNILSDRINVASESTVGNMYGMQSILQMYKSNPDAFSIGTMRDYPRFSTRGFVLDAARKPVSMDMLKEISRTMRYYKMNDFQVHLSDNYIWLEDYGKLDQENQAFDAYDAFRLESSLTNDAGESPTAEDYSFSKKEFKEFIQTERAVGVNIVPEIDVPAHANSFTKVWPELKVTNKTSSTSANRPLIDHLDISKTETVQKIEEIFDDYTHGSDATFDSETTVHIGADEFLDNYSAYRNFINTIIPYVKQTNTVRMWGGLTWIKDNPITQINADAIDGVEMNLWSKDWADGIEMYNMGYDLINTIDDYGYMVPDGSKTRANSYGDLLNTSRIFSSFEPNKLRSSSGYVAVPSGDDQMLGAAFALWNDNIDKRASGLSESDLYWRFFDALPFYAEKTWAATGQEKGSADALNTLATSMGTGPNTNPYYQESSVDNIYESYDFNSGKGLDDTSENDRDLTLASDSTAKVQNKALVLSGDKSYVETPIEQLGNGNALSFDITLSSEPESGDILFESDAAYGTHDIRIMSNGKLGFTRELYDYYFDYTLPVGEKVNIKIVTQQQVTKLYVNGQFVSNATGEFNHNGTTKKSGITNATFALPLQRIGSETNAVQATIDNVNVTAADMYNKSKWTGTTNSETTYNNVEGLLRYAFDNDYTSRWHSNWKGATDKLTGSNSFYAEINFGQKYTINQFSFTPRTDTASGYVTKADLYIKANDSDEWTLVAQDQTFAADAAQKTFTFDAQEVQYVKFVAKASSDGWVAVSEFDIANTAQDPDQPEADKTALQELVNQAVTDFTGYTSESVTAYKVALDNAKEVLTNEDATQAEVDEAIAALTNAVLVTDKSKLQEKIDQAVTDFDGYTADSVAAYKAALARLNEVLADTDATPAQVSEAIAAFDLARLVKDTSDDGKKDDDKKDDDKKNDDKKDDNKKDDSKKEDGTNDNSSSTNGKADKKDTASKAAKTGDASTALPYMLLMLASGSAVVILKKKKEQ